MHSKKTEGNSNTSYSLSVREFIENKPCLCFFPRDTLYEATCKMRENHSSAAIVTEKQKLVGLLTEHGILTYLLSCLPKSAHSIERVSNAFNTLTAGEAMIKNPMTVEAETDIHDIFHVLTENGLHYIPVICNKLPVGILSRDEIIQFMEEEKGHELESKDMMLSYLMHHENYGCV